MVSPFRENRLRSLKEQLVEEKNEETFAINCIFFTQERDTSASVEDDDV